MNLIVRSDANFVSQVMQLPVLLIEEENQLFTEWKVKGCKKSAEKLIYHNMRIVIKHAFDYARAYKLCKDDLVQEGAIGLLKALETYRLPSEARFHTYATMQVKSMLMEFTNRNLKVVPLYTTKYEKKAYFHRKELLACRNDVERKAFGEKYGMSLEEVYKSLDKLSVTNFSINSVGENADGDANLSFDMPDPNNHFEHIEEEQEEQEARNFLYAHLSQLNERQQDIIRNRYLIEEPLTLDTLAKKHNVSAERIRQIEKESIDKLRKLMVH